jgi:hypothetical protein
MFTRTGQQNGMSFVKRAIETAQESDCAPVGEKYACERVRVIQIDNARDLADTVRRVQDRDLVSAVDGIAL